MRKAKVYKNGEIKTKPYNAHSFNQNEDFLSSMVAIEKLRRKNSKEDIKRIATELGLDFDRATIKFARKVMNKLLDEAENGK